MNYNQGLIDRLESRNYLLESLIQEVVDQSDEGEPLSQELIDRLTSVLVDDIEDFFEDLDAE